MCVVALCAMALMVEPVVANEYDVKPTKKEIRAKVAEYFESQIMAAKAQTPVSVVMELISFFEWYLPLDDKSCEYADKQIDVWKRKNDKKYSMYRDYITASIAVLAEEDFKDHAPKLISYIYLDAVAEYSDWGNQEAATEMYYNYVVYTLSCSLDGYVPDHVSVWVDEKPDRAKLISGTISGYDHDTMMSIIGAHFEEDYSTMSANEQVASYVGHLDGIAECYDEGDNLDLYRHYIAIEHIVAMGNNVLLESASSEWEEEYPERAELVYEALEKLSK